MGDEDRDRAGDEPPAEASKKYDQAFFLDLAAKGKDAWNAWRRAHKDARVTFEGVDFSRKDQIDFSGFEFGHHANFSKCKWRGAEWQECEDNRETFTFGRACFTSATSGHGARFSSSAFGNGADFSGVKFDHGASFPNAVFGHGAFFKDAAFGHRATFDSAAFGNRANFNGAAFGEEASFNGATFGERASFEGAAFANRASFDNSAFGYEVSFAGATFGERAKFTGVLFGSDANFAAAAFSNLASFTGAAFGNQANFAGAAFGELASFDDTVFKGRVEITGINFEKWGAFKALLAVGHPHKGGWSRHGPGPECLLSISFARALFNGEADFSGRTFEGNTNFTNSRFYYPPDFDGVTNTARINFTGAHIAFVRPGHLQWTCKTEVPVRLRVLRKIAEDTKNHDLERDLYIEERKAERGVYWRQLSGLDELEKKLEDINKQKKHVWLEWRLCRTARNAHWLGILTKPDKIARLAIHGFWIGAMGLYWALADYGRNFVVPAIWLVLSVPFFDWRYTEVLGRLMAKPPDADKYKQAVGMLALGNAVPFIGPLTIDAKIKEFLFCAGEAADKCTPIPPEGFQFWVIAQNLISITLVFFIGLALRNYFKIK